MFKLALNSRCSTCRALLGPEDYVGGNLPELCGLCRDREARAAAEPPPAPKTHWEIEVRQAKALAMACVIDANFRRQFPDLDVFDQAGRILLASWDWTDEQWERIGETALKPNGQPYERKPISRETRKLVREIYDGRAKAPLAARNAS